VLILLQHLMSSVFQQLQDVAVLVASTIFKAPTVIDLSQIASVATAPASVAVPVTAARVDTSTASVAGIVQFLALSQNSSATTALTSVAVPCCLYKDKASSAAACSLSTLSLQLFLDLILLQHL
jgi:fructose-bisphosphate aldolase class 1